MDLLAHWKTYILSSASRRSLVTRWSMWSNRSLVTSTTDGSTVSLESRSTWSTLWSRWSAITKSSYRIGVRQMGSYCHINT